MKNNEHIFSEITLCPKEMQKKDESSSPWFVQDAESTAVRSEVMTEVMVLILIVAARVLTPRQKVIFHLRYQEQRTQVEIAGILKISQATVNNHLIGKMKTGKAVGGALQKIRKGIRKAAAKKGGTDTRHRQLISVLNSILDPAMTRRCMHSRIKGLRIL